MAAVDQRSNGRRDMVGRAFWSLARREGSCALRNVSTGGALIERPDMPLEVGQRLELTLDLGGESRPTVPASVVRMANGAVAFRFERVTPALLDALAKVTSEPASS